MFPLPSIAKAKEDVALGQTLCTVLTVYEYGGIRLEGIATHLH